MPNQFIVINAATPFPLNETKPLVATGTLQLTGQDESGIFYKLRTQYRDSLHAQSPHI